MELEEEIMASTEYDNCFNCKRFNGERCSRLDAIVSKKGWCAQHDRERPHDINTIAVEYENRRDFHMYQAMSQVKEGVTVEKYLTMLGWDGIERVRAGKFPEESDKVECHLQCSRCGKCHGDVTYTSFECECGCKTADVVIDKCITPHVAPEQIEVTVEIKKNTSGEEDEKK